MRAARVVTPSLPRTAPACCPQCGSCWAYAAAGAIESKVLITLGKTWSEYPIDLSEQSLIDCANAAAGYASAGCEGGFLGDALTYASR